MRTAREKSRCDARRADLKIRAACTCLGSPVVPRTRAEKEDFTLRERGRERRDFDARILGKESADAKTLLMENTAIRLSFGLVS